MSEQLVTTLAVLVVLVVLVIAGVVILGPQVGQLVHLLPAR